MGITDHEIKDLERKLKEARAKQAAEERREKAAVARAKRDAGDNHTKTMIKLYELFDVEPEHTQTRVLKAKKTEYAVDRGETLRSQRLLTMIESLLDQTDADVLDLIRDEDKEDRDSRRHSSSETAEKTSPDSNDTAAKDTTESLPRPFNQVA